MHAIRQRRRLRAVVRFVSCAVAAVALSGCLTMPTTSDAGSGPGQLLGTVFARFSVPSAFREHVRKGEAAQALALYDAHAALLDEQCPDEVRQLARSQNDAWHPKLLRARQDLDAALADPEVSPDRLEGALQAATNVQGQYAAVKLLADPKHTSPAAAQLRGAIDSAPRRYVDLLARSFGGYDHAKGRNLFQLQGLAVPADDQARIVHANVQALARAIESAPESRAKELVAAYRPLVKPDARAPIDRALVARLTAAASAKGARLSFAQLVEISRQARDAGIDGYQPFRTAALAGGSSRPVSIDGSHVAASVAPSQVSQFVAQAGSEGAGFVLFVDPATTSHVHELREPRMQSERRQVGTRQVPNPDYEAARQAYEEAVRTAQDIERQNADLQRQAQELARSGGSKFGAILGAGMGTFALQTARQDVQRTREAMESTSRTRAEPVFQNFQKPVATAATEAVGAVSLYLVDVGTRQVSIGRHALTDRQETVVAAGDAATQRPAAAVPRDLSLTAADLAPRFEGKPVPLASLPSEIERARRTFAQELSARQRASEETSQRTAQALSRATGGSAQAGGGAAATAQVAAASARSAAGGRCHTSLRYLDRELPNFSVPKLQEVRSKIVSTDVMDAIAQAKAQGFDADRAVDASNESARSMESQLATASQCAAETSAWGGSDAAFLRAAKSGSLANISSCDGIHASCVCMALILRMGAVASRAMAAAMQCHAGNGSW